MTMTSVAREEEPVSLDRDWSAAAASAVGLVFSVGSLLLYSFGVFVHPLTTAFGWSRTELSGAVAISQYSLAFTAPVWGWLIDRYGPRAVLLPSVVAVAVLFASLGWLTPHLWHLYIIFALIPIMAGGASPLGYSAVLIRRFDRKLGQALGIALMGVGIGAAILPTLAQSVVGSLGWRGAYVVLGGLALACAVPAALIATRAVATPPPRLTFQAGDVSRAVRTRRFVLICAAFVLIGIASLGVLAHLVPMMVDRGFSPAAAAKLAGLTGLAAVVARGGLGWLLDRIHAPYLLAAIAALAMAAFLLLAYGTSPASSYLAALLLGFVVGAEVDFISFLIRRYFDPALFGRLYGIAFGLYLLGVGTGPLAMGASFDHLGGYRAGLLGFTALAGIVAALAFAMPTYASPTALAQPRELRPKAGAEAGRPL